MSLACTSLTSWAGRPVTERTGTASAGQVWARGARTLKDSLHGSSCALILTAPASKEIGNREVVAPQPYCRCGSRTPPRGGHRALSQQGRRHADHHSARAAAEDRDGVLPPTSSRRATRSRSGQQFVGVRRLCAPGWRRPEVTRDVRGPVGRESYVPTPLHSERHSTRRSN